MKERLCLTILLGVLAAARVARAQEPPPPPAPEAAAGEGAQWRAPETLPPVLPKGPVKMRPPVADAKAAAAPSRYASLLAVSTKDGEAILKTLQGDVTVRPGDALSGDTVKAVAEGMLVLRRPAVPGKPGGESTVVLRFDAQGKPSVRIYYAGDPTPAEPPRAR